MYIKTLSALSDILNITIVMMLNFACENKDGKFIYQLEHRGGLFLIEGNPEDWSVKDD